MRPGRHALDDPREREARAKLRATRGVKEPPRPQPKAPEKPKRWR